MDLSRESFKKHVENRMKRSFWCKSKSVYSNGLQKVCGKCIKKNLCMGLKGLTPQLTYLLIPFSIDFLKHHV